MTCSPRTDRQTQKSTEWILWPLSWIFPSTYHQGSLKYELDGCAIYTVSTWGYVACSTTITSTRCGDVTEHFPKAKCPSTVHNEDTPAETRWPWVNCPWCLSLLRVYCISYYSSSSQYNCARFSISTLLKQIRLCFFPFTLSMSYSKKEHMKMFLLYIVCPMKCYPIRFCSVSWFSWRKLDHVSREK